ncbi:hypothetical protein HMPREF0758_0679 [Serratia odorifera DSM 4582]|uniref:Uncharacterized protein n=1 Tax=Serratia odorifera DSM 4582 TaxID=667129 RepID=D4DXM9_SEROD|nr:hypothetical protein HMPREF0758_0679 [Serratia odorifera DSM 4582]
MLWPPAEAERRKQLNIELKVRRRRARHGAPGFIFENNNHYLLERAAILPPILPERTLRTVQAYRAGANTARKQPSVLCLNIW